jgi:c-di-GMP-binding flagellar brake protein YcgR
LIKPYRRKAEMLSFFKKKLSAPNTRMFRRLQSAFSIKYNPLFVHGKKKGVTASLIDISGGGILFTAKEALPINTMINVSIDFSPISHPVDVIGKVIRSVKSSQPKGYSVAVKFLDIGAKDKKAIINAIEEISKKDTGGKKKGREKLFHRRKSS